MLFSESDWTTLSAGQKKGYGNLVDHADQRSGGGASLLGDGQERLRDAARITCVPRDSEGCFRMLPFSISTAARYAFARAVLSYPEARAPQVTWKDLVGASPATPRVRSPLARKDNGWLAAYFDVLWRVNQSQQRTPLENARLKRLYEDLRGTDTEPPATRGVFRKAPDLSSCSPAWSGSQTAIRTSPAISSMETDRQSEDRFEDRQGVHQARTRSGTTPSSCSRRWSPTRASSPISARCRSI